MAEKARIQVLEGPDQGAISVMFNPSEYTVSTTVQATGEGAQVQFKLVNMPEFTVTFFFDTYEKQSDVRKETEKIRSLTMPTVEGRETKRPPLCLFLWGGLSYKGIISRVDQKFTMFLETGIPVRAELTVTLKAVVSPEEDTQRKGNEACRKLWTVKTGDRLDVIAYKALKDPAQWKKIARVNDIVDPLAFPTDGDIGKMLIIPDT